MWSAGFLALVFMNVGLYNFLSEKIQQQNYQIFLDITSEAETDIKNKIHTYEEALWGGVGLFNASQAVERSEWKSYVNALDLERYGGINGIGFIQNVPKKDLSNFFENHI